MAADNRKKVFTSTAQFGELRHAAEIGIEAGRRSVSAQRDIPSGAGKAGFRLDGRGRRGPECRLRPELLLFRCRNSFHCRTWHKAAVAAYDVLPCDTELLQAFVEGDETVRAVFVA
jgi:hypothetical protein